MVNSVTVDDTEIVVVIDRPILQHAIEAIARSGNAYIDWIEKLPVRDAYHVALVIGMLMQADRCGRFHA